MIETLKKQMKKQRFLYQAAQRSYYWVQKTIETSIVGTRLQEWRWRSMSVNKGYGMEKRFDLNNIHPHRTLLINQFSNRAPFDRVLEIGCNTGANLYHLARSFPGAQLDGIDVSSKAIEAGIKMMADAGIQNVYLNVRKADELDIFDDKSIDIVLTDATLMYIGPDKIRKVLSEMIRISRKALVINEWQMVGVDSQRGSMSVYYYAHWIHDYISLLSEFVARDKIRCSRVPPGIWNDVNWDTYGSTIEVNCQGESVAR